MTTRIKKIVFGIPDVTVRRVLDNIDVDITGIRDKQYLRYDDDNSLFVPSPGFDSALDSSTSTIRGMFGAAGDLTYDSATGVFSIDVEQIYTKENFDSDLGDASTDDLPEGSSNLYYTTARADSDFDIRLATKSTDDVAEGDNLYYTTARADSDAKHAIAAGTGIDYSSSTGTISILATGVDSGTYGSASQVPVITINSRGQIDSAGSVSVAGVSSTSFDSSSGTYTINTADGGSFATVIADSDFTNKRARLAISVTDAGGDGSFSYDNTTGVLTYTGPSASEVRSHLTAQGDLTYDSATGVFSIDVIDSGNVNALITTAIDNLIDGAPTALDTLNELAAALNDDANFASTVTALIAALPDSAQVSSIITADVDKTFVDALNVDADTLDGQDGTYYLDYTNFTNTPNVLDSANVISIIDTVGFDSDNVLGLVDSAYVQARQLSGGGSSSQVYAVDGADSSPSISFLSDSDTGLYRPKANQIAITTHGTTKATFGGDSTEIFSAFDSDGNNVFSIGVGSASDPLLTVNDSDGNSVFSIGVGSASDPLLTVNDSAGNSVFSIDNSTTGVEFTLTDSVGSIVFKVDEDSATFNVPIIADSAEFSRVTVNNTVGTIVFKAVATTDTPTKNPAIDSADGWLKIQVGDSDKYIPFYS